MAEGITFLGGGRYRVTEGGRSRIAWAVDTSAGTWVFLDGRQHVVAPESHDDRREAAPRADDLALAAPMPATVVAVRVQPGAAVRAGDVLILLEAMKMELAITAPRDGRIGGVACREGELVQPGVPLVHIE